MVNVRRIRKKKMYRYVLSSVLLTPAKKQSRDHHTSLHISYTYILYTYIIIYNHYHINDSIPQLYSNLIINLNQNFGTIS